MTDAHRTEDPKLWKVDVLCEGLIPVRTTAKKSAPRLERRYIKVLVSAADGSSAMEAGKSYADANAAPGVQWKRFTPLGAARVVLPMALDDFQ
jgi:hypothetical protein